MKKETICGIIKEPRAGCKDIFNAYMCKDAMFGRNDIPHCPTTATKLPEEVITWEEAKNIYKKQLRLKNENFTHKAFVCFYMDDYKFDGSRGIWHDSAHALKVIRHFGGVITPDFSTYQDFPEPLKIYNTYRMRVFGYWLVDNDVKVIPNVRWGDKRSYDFCCNGVGTNGTIAIGSHGCIKLLTDRPFFEEGLKHIVHQLHPKTIIVYGAAPDKIFDAYRKMGISIVQFDSVFMSSHRKAVCE